MINSADPFFSSRSRMRRSIDGIDIYATGMEELLASVGPGTRDPGSGIRDSGFGIRDSGKSGNLRTGRAWGTPRVPTAYCLLPTAYDVRRLLWRSMRTPR